ncbi:MAG: hypothetical protein NTW28_07270 [Candidatus Solibacter sp.]|nr:hypothetical protein [Candidatus Solibacter sp.]
MTINARSSSLAATQVTASRRPGTTNQVRNSTAVQDDSPQVSKLGSYMKQLASLLETNPDKFKDTTATIAQKLEAAAKSAADSGDTRLAAALNDLAAKFKTASETGTMPQLHREHGGHHRSSTNSSSSSSSSGTLSTDLATLMAEYSKHSGSDPMSTLSGILDDVFGSANAS